MKRTILGTVLLSLLTFCAFNQPRHDDEKHFAVQPIDGGQAVRIIEYLGSGESVRIPPQIGCLPVTEIGRYAFSSSELTNVTIPGSVTVIGEAAFADNRLTSITIPNSVQSIGAGAFGMNDLVEVTIPKGISVIEKLVFAGNSLISVTIPHNVTTIGDMAFAYNDALVRISIGPNVAIAQDAFENGFADYYIENGCKAGIYIFDSGSWIPERGPEDGQT